MNIKNVLYYLTKFVGIFIVTCTIFVCLFFGYIYYCNLAKMSTPTLGPIKMYMVLSDSMANTFIKDDVIFTVATDPEKINVGDIISFNTFNNTVIITHRVFQKEKVGDTYEFQTKGDNNNTVDNFTTLDSQIVGKYFLKIPQFGYYLKYVQSNTFIIIIPVAILIIFQIMLSWLEKFLKPDIKTKIPEDQRTMNSKSN